MYELWVSVDRCVEACPAKVPMTPGVGFLIRLGRMIFFNGGPICLHALQNYMPILTAKQREINETKEADWMWRVHHVQCPNPGSRIIWRLEQRPLGSTKVESHHTIQAQSGDLQLSVCEVLGKCTSGMKEGDFAIARNGLLYLPQPFCLWPLQTAIPRLLSMQQPGYSTNVGPCAYEKLICPDPSGNVVLQIERV